MTREEAREFLINISYSLGNMSVEYLSEKDGKKMREAIKALEQEPKWIPVSERLPEEDGFYLATLDGEICGEDKPFCGLAEFEKGKWIDDEEDYQCIIAWMPLPEPYKAEGSENEK